MGKQALGYTRLELSFPFLGSSGDPCAAEAVVIIPKHQGPHPVAVFLGALSDLHDDDDDGRKHFCRGAEQFVFITPKGHGVLTTQDPDAEARRRRRYDEQVLFFLLQRCLVETERRVPRTVDVTRIAVTGLSLGGEAALNLAAVPGAGRILMGLAPVACRGHDHLVYTETALREMRQLPIWGVQIASDNPEYKMNQMLQFLGCYGSFLFPLDSAVAGDVEGVELRLQSQRFGPEEEVGSSSRSTSPGATSESAGEEPPNQTLIELGAPPRAREVVVYPEDCDPLGQSTRKREWEYWREVRKYKFGSNVCLWEISDSRADTWKGRDKVKHHDAWTPALKEGVGKEKRTFATWALGLESNPCAAFVWGDTTYSVALAQPLPSRYYAGILENTATACAAATLVVGSHPLWRYRAVSDAGADCDTADELILVGDIIEPLTGGVIQVKRQAWVSGGSLSNALPRGTSASSTTDEARVEYYRWWCNLEVARRAAFRTRCCGQWDVAVDYHSARVVYLDNSFRRSGGRLYGSALRAAKAFLRSVDHAFCLQHDVLAALPAHAANFVGNDLSELPTTSLVATAMDNAFDPNIVVAEWGLRRQMVSDWALALQMQEYQLKRRRCETDPAFAARWVANIRRYLEHSQINARGLPVSYVNSRLWLDRQKSDPTKFAISRSLLRRWDTEKVFKLLHDNGKRRDRLRITQRV